MRFNSPHHQNAAPRQHRRVPAIAHAFQTGRCLPARRQLIVALAAVLGAGTSLPIRAADGDVLTPFVNYSVTYDDNVLRLHDGAAAQALIGTDQLSDVSRRAQAGVVLDKKIGQQLLSANLSVSKTAFSHFSELDHTGRDLLAQWRWHIGSHLEGNLGIGESEGLAPFIDFHRLERNLRNHRREYFDAAWRLHPRWRLRSGVAHYRHNYDLPSQRAGNRTEDVIEAGLDYLAPSNSSFGVQLRHIEGDFPQREQVGPALIDNSYGQHELKANIDWRASAKSRLQFLGGHVRRHYDAFPERNFSGVNARAIATWEPTVKTGVIFNVWRETNAYLDVATTSTINSGVSATLNWKPTEKLLVDSTLNFEQRAFSGADTAAAGLSGKRNDVFRHAAVGLAYRPVAKILVKTSLFRDQRDSRLPLNGYRANGATITISFEI
jgi:exopolysaccharide biosynthesis operon protein EpsL